MKARQSEIMTAIYQNEDLRKRIAEQTRRTWADGTRIAMSESDESHARQADALEWRIVEGEISHRETKAITRRSFERQLKHLEAVWNAARPNVRLAFLVRHLIRREDSPPDAGGSPIG